MQTQTKINELIKEVNELSLELEARIYNICNELPHPECSKFTYNIDYLSQFVKYLNEFKK